MLPVYAHVILENRNTHTAMGTRVAEGPFAETPNM